MELYLIRHAQSTNNVVAGLRNRVCDPPLTELGEQQAEIIARHLVDGINPEFVKGGSPEATGSRNGRGYAFTRLYCSAMARSLQTVEPIGQALGLTPHVWVDIHEHGGIFLDHGDQRGVVGYPGKTRSEILARYPNYRLPDEITDDGWWSGGYEDWPACHGRAIKVAQKLRKWADSDERIALITHGGFIDSLIKALANQLPDGGLFYYHYNTAITRIDFRRDERMGFRYLNRIGHLPPELIS